MSTQKNIKQSDWQDRLQSLVSGNRNRISSIVVDGNTLVESKKFLGMDYDPEGKGDDLMISVEDYSHTIDAPAELILTEASNGVVTSVEIIDQNSVSTLLKLML